MPYYHTCPLCGANLDPGERCDCTTYSLKEDFENVRNESNYRPDNGTRRSA